MLHWICGHLNSEPSNCRCSRRRAYHRAKDLRNERAAAAARRWTDRIGKETLIRVIALLAAGFVASASVYVPGRSGPQQTAIRSEPRLDSRIPAPDRSQYRAIREARAWRNPYLSISNRGFELRSLSAPEPRVVVLNDLRRVLTELPVSDWPYGRVVVVQMPSIGGQSIAAMQRDIQEAREVLKALDADEWGWPA